MILDVFTDGACANNGRPNAKASWAIVFPERSDLDASGYIEGLQTNNRAEFMAAIKALESHDGPMHIFTDSLLLVNVATGKWNAKKNTDLVSRIHKLVEDRHVFWTHVRAHTGKLDWHSRWNDEVDRRANALVL